MKYPKPYSSALSKLGVFLLIMMWSYASLSKLVDYEVFRFQLLTHPLFAAHSYIVAAIIPVAELLLTLLLIIPVTRNAGLGISAWLLTVFTIYIVYMLSAYPYTPCSCGGAIQGMSWKQHIAFNLFFLALSIFAFRIKLIHVHEPLRGGHRASAG